MGRMLAALKQLESQRILARSPADEGNTESSLESCYQLAVEESNFRVDQAHAVPLPNSEFVSSAVGTGNTAGSLSSNAFWPSLELPTFVEPEQVEVSESQRVEEEDNREQDPSRGREPENLVQESEEESQSHEDLEQDESSPPSLSKSGKLEEESEEESTPELQSDETPSHAEIENAAEHPHDREVRKLAATILHKLPTGLPAALWVTSAGGASDASRLVADLGQVLCDEESLRVLAIDAQCGRAAQRVEQGFIQALEDPSEWRNSVRTTGVDGLSVIPGGVGTTARAAEHDASLKPLLDQACRDYDVVLIDGGAANNPVTEQMAAECDASLVLVRLGETDRRYARQMVDSLSAAKVNVLGCVLAGA